MSVRKTVRIVADWLCVFLVMLVIFSFSAQNGTSSEGSSDSVVNLVAAFFAFFGLDINDTETLSLFVRKAAHFTAYMLLAPAVMNALYDSRSGIRTRFLWLFTMLICLTYAASDEFHQYFSPGRSMSAYDVLIDMCGAAAGGGLYSAIRALWMRKRRTESDARR